LLAAELPFARIVGVEFASELHEKALKNIQAYRNPQQRCADISSVCIDAREFTIPNENCVLYFYRPFRGPVFDQVIRNIEQSYRDNPRKIFLAYCSPFLGDPLAASEVFRPIPVRGSFLSRALPDDVHALLYESRDRPSSRPAA
jgi:hypothetical protein